MRSFPAAVNFQLSALRCPEARHDHIDFAGQSASKTARLSVNQAESGQSQAAIAERSWGRWAGFEPGAGKKRMCSGGLLVKAAPMSWQT
jgi:hypothetical protein